MTLTINVDLSGLDSDPVVLRSVHPWLEPFQSEGLKSGQTKISHTVCTVDGLFIRLFINSLLLDPRIAAALT